MSEVAVNEVGEADFTAMDPGLSLLASRAAVELDNLLVRGSRELEAVRLLGERLSRSTEAVEDSSDRRTLMDPPTVSIMNSALIASRVGQPRTLAELAGEAWRIAKELHGTSAEQDKAVLQKLRTFCVCLAQSSRSFRQMFLDVEPTHPYRS